MIERTDEPDDANAVAAVVRQTAAADRPVYPIGGGTALEFGLPVKAPGVGLSLAKLARLIDYPARDMTVTVEAGITMAELARTLADENQELPIDAPNPEQATIGGVIASNWSGPRRFGHGTIRDYVLGISAVDGLGRPFKGGGRVVKNVAGYDFCRMLCGSLGTLGVITQVTLKVKPRPEATAYLACNLPTWGDADKLLAAIVQSKTTPAAVELFAGDTNPIAISGSANKGAGIELAVGLEGTIIEVDWMLGTLADEWRGLGVRECRRLEGNDAEALHTAMTAWPSVSAGPLLIKATLRPSGVTTFIQQALAIDPACAIQAHAGNGIVLVRFANCPPGFVTQQLLAKLYPLATSHGGHAVILRADSTIELTRSSAFCGSDLPWDVMRAVKAEFDPQGILNRGRFWY